MKYRVWLAESQSKWLEGRYRVALGYRASPAEIPASIQELDEVSITVTVSFELSAATAAEDYRGRGCLEVVARGIARTAVHKALSREGGPLSSTHLLIARNSLRRGDLDPSLQEAGRGIPEGDQGDEVGFCIEVGEPAQT